ncbi:MAG TPA: cytochrome c [Acidobacteriaceae bacterium]|jgi:cytochrome c553|nr:cytochrome c [Acidobacteriaceae bacterium]
MRCSIYVAFTGLLVLACGCKVKHPGSAETRIVTGIKHRITVGGKSMKNPVTFTPEHLADGKEAFGHYCTACHGLDGQNTGVPFAENMSPPLPSLASPDVQSYSDGQLKWVIDNGVAPSGMPASSGTLSNDEIWSIVLYLRHLPPAGSLGEPEFYSH